MSELRKQIIIGGGLAGLAGAFWCRRQDPHTAVVLYEKEEDVLSWAKRLRGSPLVLGRELASRQQEEERIVRGMPEVSGVLGKWTGQATREWLESLGIDLERGEEGTFYAKDGDRFRKQFRDVVEGAGVEIRTGFSLESLSPQPGGGFRIWSREGVQDACGSLLLTTGGGRNHGMAIAREEGGMGMHPPVPAYLRLRLASARMGDRLGPLEGVVRLRCPRHGTEVEGGALLSSRGLEGEAVSRLSGSFCEAWKDRGYRIQLEVDWLPAMNRSELRGELSARSQSGRRNPVGGEALFGFNLRQWQAFLGLSRIDPKTPWVRLRTRQLQTLVHRLKAHSLAFSGMGLPKGERAWAGGIEREAIDWSTCEAAGTRGLYLAGEILDVLGEAGGSHMNLGWASAYVAGSAMAHAKRGTLS